LNHSAYLDSADPALADLRARGRNALTAVGLPAGKLEAWKYTPIESLYAEPFVTVGGTVSSLAGRSFLDDWDVHRCELNQPHDQLPSIPGVTMTALDAGNQGLADIEIDASRYPLAKLNAALINQGIFIDVPAETSVTLPVALLYRTSGSASCTRVLIHLGRNSHLDLLEEHVDPTPANRVTEVRMSPGASMLHTRLQADTLQPCWHLLDVNVPHDADYRLLSLTRGGSPRRNDTRVRLTGDGARARLDGVLVGSGDERLDNQITVEHEAAGAWSRQTIRGIAADKSRLTFGGRIHIHRQAGRTDAALSNKNLLLAPTATINTKPELEIYADDVQCAHGATVGELDEQALFYLQSRGIDVAVARELLMLAFINACIDDHPHADRLAAVTSELLTPWV
jgi:Fe-S cluster assembly protein SufD